MKGLPPELVYVLLFAAILLVQFLMRRGAKAEEGESTKRAPRTLDERLAEMLGGVLPGREAEPPPAPAVDAFPVEVSADESRPIQAEVRRRPLAARSMLTGRRNLRRAVVAMTVLGPCRAMQPPDDAHTGPFPGQAAR